MNAVNVDIFIFIICLSIFYYINNYLFVEVLTSLIVFAIQVFDSQLVSKLVK